MQPRLSLQSCDTPGGEWLVQKSGATVAAGRGAITMSSMIHRRSIRTTVVALMLVWASARAADTRPGVEAPEAAPAAAPATAPATGPAGPAEAAPARGNISEAAIELSEREQTALGAVRDRNTQLAETAFFMLLSRAGKMETLSDRQIQDIESPSYPNLMAYPARYRAQPIRMVVHIFASRKFTPTPGGAFPPSPYWPKDQPVWYLEGLVPSAVPGRKEQPVLIYSTADPTGLLGRADKIEGELQRYFGVGRRMVVAGLFYKITQQDSQKYGPIDYPVLLVWQMSLAGGGGGEGGGLATGGTRTVVGVMIAMVVLVLLLGFIMLKRRVSQQKASRPSGPRYKPLRDVSQDDGEPAAEEPDAVDPLLKQAAEQYQKERQSDGQHGSS